MSSPFATNLIRIEPLPTPREVLEALPASESQRALVEKSRDALTRILHGSDDRLLIVVGPCSIHDTTGAKEFASRLANLSRRVKDRILLVMRVHCEKPRTCLGWKGLLYDPELDDSGKIGSGIRISRQLFLDLAATGVPVATEFLDPISPHYLGDLVAWGQIGARTAASQIHRQMVSSLRMPVGFKNSIDGDITTAVNGVLAAQTPHQFLGMGMDGMVSAVRSAGNGNCHIVLRGGIHGPNFMPESINGAIHLLKEANLPSRLMVDCSHDNCSREHQQQRVAFQSVLRQVEEGQSGIMGMIIESYIQEGKQAGDSASVASDVSITDPCLNWADTESLVLEAYERLSQVATVTALP
jgi:3-deoxy-7-phosphoheptulonate synthase